MMKKRNLILTGVACLAAVTLVAQLTPEQEKHTRGKAARTHSDLRSLATGIEAYRIDNRVYPYRLQGLTTPISYITGFIPDQFDEPYDETVPVPEHLTPKNRWHGAPGLLKMGVARNEESVSGWTFVIYGNGPDRDDDQGQIIYDPTNGTVSDGDIVRYLDPSVLPAISHDQEVQISLDQSMKNIRIVEDKIIQYYGQANRFPATLDVLTDPDDPYIDAIPEDPFLPGLSMGYFLEDDGQYSTATIYSVGPDLDDDAGRLMVDLMSHDDPLDADGDLFITMNSDTVERRLYPNKQYIDARGDSPTFAGLIQNWQDQNDGRENAFHYYAKAEEYSPGVAPRNESQIIDEIIEGNTERADGARKYLNLWDNAFALMEEGVEVNFAEGPGAPLGYNTPSLNYLSPQLLTKAMIAEAILALDDHDSDRCVRYLTNVIVMGRDFQSRGNFLIAHLIGYAVTNMGLTGAEIAINSGKLNLEQLGLMQQTLMQAKRNRTPIVEAFLTEKDATIVSFRKDWESGDFLEMLNLRIIDEGMVPLEENPNLEKVIGIITFEKDHVIGELSRPWPSRPEEPIIPEIPESFFDGMLPEEKAAIHKMVGTMTPNYIDTGTREATMKARLDLTILATGIRIWELETGSAPESLDQMIELTGGTELLDPFTNQPYHYEVTDGGWKIFSTGPDRDTDGAAVEYDPVNGTVSDGDIIFGSE